MKLAKPLVVFDLETTGTWLDKDRIIEIAMIKCLPDGNQETYHKKVNPLIPIPEVVAELTGISDEDVKDAPVFRAIAKEVLDFIGDADFGGFNVERFDLPLLTREMQEAGHVLDLKSRKIYDAQKVFHINEKRDLTAAVQFYCQKDLDNAHSALADTQATLDVIKNQVVKYGEGNEDIAVLEQFDYQVSSEFIDPDRRLRLWNGEIYMMFGKYAKNNTLRDIAQKDPGYLEWILTKDFSDEVKDKVEWALKGFPT